MMKMINRNNIAVSSQHDSVVNILFYYFIYISILFPFHLEIKRIYFLKAVLHKLKTEKVVFADPPFLIPLTCRVF